MWDKEAPAAGVGGALRFFLNHLPWDGTHSPVWMDLINTGTMTSGSLRTLQTKGQTWVESRVMWNKEGPAAGAGGALYQDY